MTTPPDSLRGLRVLVVEDEALIAEEIRDRLTRLGAVVVDTADTADRAVRAAEEYRPGLVLMDIRLKGPADGVQAAEAILRTAPTPVVFLTAHSDEETLRRAMAAEPFGYLLKPFHERDLVVAVEMALNRHRLEQQLKESERRYVATLSSIGDGVIATDRDCRVSFLNPVAEALTGWRRADAVRQPVDAVYTVVDETTTRPVENPVVRAVRTRQVVKPPAPTLLADRAGQFIPIDDTAAPILDDAGRLLGAVAAFRDIRDRRLAEDALRRAEEQLRQAVKLEAVGRLAGGVAHDFNNLLTVINGYSELLLGGAGLPPAAGELVGEIKKAGERAAGLTQQLLAFSRKQVLNPAAVQLGGLVASLSRMLTRLIGEDVVLITSAASDLWPILADPGQVEQVIMNLVVNARDAMPEGGRLTLTSRNEEVPAGGLPDRPEIPPGRYVRLAVTDTGTGMDRATLARIFDPFFTTKEVGKGTGLGLATVYGIVRQSGGYVFAESEAGRGTTFTLYFPVTDSVAEATAAPAQAAVRRGSESVLLVEDDDAVRTLSAVALRRVGYTVQTAAGGAEAVRLFSANPAAIDLVVSDLVMPGMSGRELAVKLRAIRPDLRILFVSGYTRDAVPAAFRDAGTDFLPKPYRLDVLAQRVRQALDAVPA